MNEINQYGEPPLTSVLTEKEHRDLCVWLRRIQHATPCTLGAHLLETAKHEAHILARGVALEAVGPGAARICMLWATAMATAPIELRHVCVHIVNDTNPTGRVSA